MTTTAESTAEQLLELQELLAKARDAWAFFQADVEALKQAMAQTPELAGELRRIEAYGALVGRDEGMGQSMEGWLDEIAEEIRIGYDAANMQEGDAR